MPEHAERPGLMNSLYARLALGLVALVMLLGAVNLAIMLHAGRLYQQELNQQLNRKLAANLIAENKLQVEEGRFDPGALESIFHTYMVVNPAIEVYLLDAAGRILAFSAPAEKVKRDHVDLAPIHAFLDAGEGLPIVGDDPRNRTGRKVFSAAPIGPAERPQGYLYVVLAGEQLDSAAAMLRDSYILRAALYVVVGAALFGVLAGLWLLFRITRRLRRLDHAMSAFAADDFSRLPPLAEFDTDSQDELGRLGRTFKSMAEHIASQVGTLKQTDALRRELVANVSHDLRTPIASLQGYLETLLMKADTLSADERNQYLRTAMRHSERLGTLVAELFELAKLESGHTQLHREAFAPGELVQDVVLKYQLPAREAGIHIEAEISPNLPFVDADIALIERVLENLLENAVRHTPAGGSVRVTLASDAGGVRVQVADTGHGIPSEELPRLFDRFYQAKKSQREVGEGVGLGLAIVKRILELHAVPIAVYSTLRAGTRFDFSLPASALNRRQLEFECSAG
jgi:two-component system OmpR family sensor kinase